MLLRLLTLAFILMMTIPIFAQTPMIETGVSITLANWRSANYSDVRYKLNLTLEKMSPTLKGTIEISVKNNADQIVLDWRKIRGKEDLSTVSNVSVNGSELRLQPRETITGLVPGVTLNYEEINEHLVFKDGVTKGENVIKLDFTSPIATSGAAITRYVDKEDGAEYIYSLFVPSDASTAFPVFDQPDLKARFKLSVTAPKDWKVVTNTDFYNHFDLEGVSRFVSVQGNSATSAFWETEPISTYVFAFAAGNFEVFSESEFSKTKQLTTFSFPRRKMHHDKAKDVWTEDEEGIEIYVRKSQAEKFKQHAAEVFRLNREGVKFLESWFDYKFPFPKYDLVLIPEFPFGGMEHAGATFLRESSVIFPTDPTKNDFVSRANLIFHEAAHQWFGDTVTMKWFDDLWLKEGFAEFMAYKTLEKVLPEYNAWKIFYERNKQAAYLTDSTKGTTPIYQEIPNLSSAKSAYGNIVYRKAPSFLKQAEFYLGEKKFQTAVHAFLKKHEFANAEWKDLVNEFNKVYDRRGVPEWANVWVTKPGLPIISKQSVKGWNEMHGCCFYSFYQINSLETGTNWREKTKFLQIIVNSQTQKEKKRTTFNLESVGPMTSILSADDGSSAPFFGESTKGYGGKDKSPFFGLPPDGSYFVYIPNYQDYGYGIFLLDEKSRAYVLENIQNEKDDFLRTMMWGALWDSVRETELAPKVYVALVIKSFSSELRLQPRNTATKEITPKGVTLNAGETDESTIQTLLNRASTAMNYYLSDAQRDEFTPQIEAILINKMQNAPTLGQRITFYRAFLNVALSEKARQVLKEILNGKFQIKDLKLKTKDKFDTLTRLLILGDKDAPNLLAELEKVETSDEAKRYAYAAKAGIATAENKAKFYNDFVGNKEISERWIEAAFVPFNSSKHAELILPFLEKALAELPNLKRGRKIFFVNGWLGAFIGGQRSEQALAIVNKFLTDNPNLDRDLRLKILENADGLERAVKIRAKFAK